MLESTLINAMHISGIILNIVNFEILKVYCRLVYESPVARKRKVTANLSSKLMDSLQYVVCFSTCRRINNTKYKKSEYEQNFQTAHYLKIANH